jgi:hypothetical protein
MDDILDPADKEELSQKIESSEFAEDLVHRTRDVMRRLRLSAPQPVGAGMGLDPNTVAEYLDNVLPPEQVGDFERICLESDVHLAEAAACHHVLTMVLGEPAHVEPRARQRMYNIPTEARERRRLRVEGAHAMAGAVTAVGAGVPLGDKLGSAGQTAGAMGPAATPAARPGRVEIPEYLRTRSWWKSRGILAALAAVLLIGVGLFAISGWLGWGTERAGDVAIKGDESAPVANTQAGEEAADQAGEAPMAEAVDPAAPVVDDGTAPAMEAPAESVAIDSSAAPEAASDPAVGERYTTAETPGLATPPQPLTPELSAPVETPPQEVAEATAGVETMDPASAAPPALDGERPTTPVDGAATVNVSPQGATDAVPPVESATAPPRESTAATVETPPVDNTTRIAATTPDAPKEGVATAAESDLTEGAPAGPPELGTYLSGKTVLLRYDEPTGAWFRMEPRSGVAVGQRLLSLPEFRPTITLSSGLHANLAGGTQVVMSLGESVVGPGTQIGSREIPVIDVLYGRVILINTSNETNQVRLKLGPHVGEAQLEQNATLAIEVERAYVAGSDPRKAPSPTVVRMFAPEGGVVWADPTGEVASAKASRWTLAAGAPAQLVDDPAPPAWIDQETTEHASEQRFGAPVIDSTLVSDKPADIQLLELFKGSGRKEVKSLATRSSIHVGLFAPFVEALRDSQQKWPTWRTHVETLRAAMAFSPQSAERVFEALNEQRGRTAAADLYEMLCGYDTTQIGATPDEMKRGAIAQLIDWLEEDSLDYRVLAVYNLWEITGKQLMPNPAASASVRKQNVRRWRDRLAAGELAPVKRS